jgi:hypothetical protein
MVLVPLFINTSKCIVILACKSVQTNPGLGAPKKKVEFDEFEAYHVTVVFLSSAKFA